MVPKITLYTRIWIKLKEASSALGGIFGVGYNMVRPLTFGQGHQFPRERLCFTLPVLHFVIRLIVHHITDNTAVFLGGGSQRSFGFLFLFFFFFFFFSNKNPHHIYLNTLAQYYSGVVSI